MESHLVLIADGKSSPLRKGHPSIWRGDKLHEPACQWINEEIIRYSTSKGTWDTAARSAVTWLDYCSAISVEWQHALRMDLVAYRDAYLGAISPVTGRQYKASTVRTRMTFIKSFIEHAASCGTYRGDICVVRSPDRERVDGINDSVFPSAIHLNHANRISSSVSKLAPKSTNDDTVRVIRKDELQQLIRWSGNRPTERVSSNTIGCDRDYVVLALGWAVGLRADEILGLTVYPFECTVVNPLALGDHHKIAVKGKGNKTRRVDVPGWLVQDIQAYIGGERRRVLAQRGRRIVEAQLLLNGDKAKRYMGKPISKSGLDLIIKRACNDCGLTKKCERINPDTGEVAVHSRPKYSLHCLRHTYAVMAYHNMQTAGFEDLERWKYIQLQLGHSSPKVTIAVYLRHVSVWSSKRVALAISEIFG